MLDHRKEKSHASSKAKIIGNLPLIPSENDDGKPDRSHRNEHVKIFHLLISEPNLRTRMRTFLTHTTANRPAFGKTSLDSAIFFEGVEKQHPSV
jgi:hypothetical protein